MFEDNLTSRISFILDRLKSKEIIQFLNQWSIDKIKLLSLVIESKIGFDQLITENDCKTLIEDIEESSIYDVAEYTQLIMFISTMGGDTNNRFNSDTSTLNKFQTFHKMLYKTGSLVLKLLNENTVNAKPVAEPKKEQIAEPDAQKHTQQQNDGSSKVVTMSFPKMTPQERAEAESDALVAKRLEAILLQQKLLAELKLKQHVNASGHNSRSDVSMAMNDYRVHPQSSERMESNAGSSDFHEDQLGDMSLNNFLKSLAMLNVPSNSE